MRRLSRKRRCLLVLGADEHRERAFASWARAGIDTVLVNASSLARYEHAADRFVNLDARDDADPDLERLTDLARECGGVAALSELSVVTAATVAERAGLPGPGTAAARISRSKPEQRRIAHERGLPAPAARAVATREDVVEFFAERPGRAVLKPADAAASVAVYPVGDAEEALRRWAEVRAFSPSGAAILEQRLEGREISVEGIVREGRLVASSVTRKETGGPTGFVERMHLVLRDEEPELGRRAAEALAGVVAAWEVRDAVLHAEFKVSSEGLTLVEAAVRVGGELIPDLVRAALGRDLYLVQAALALGEPLPVDLEPDAACAGVRSLLATGTVRRSVRPSELIGPDDPVRVVAQLAQPGARLRELIANWTRAGYALGWGDDAEELERELIRVVAALAERMGVEEHERGAARLSGPFLPTSRS